MKKSLPNPLLYLLLLICSFSPLSADKAGTIVVQLTTEKDLINLCIAPAQTTEQEKFCSSVLHFDLHHNGKTKVVPLPFTTEGVHFQNALSKKQWNQIHNHNIRYIVFPSVKKQTLHTEILFVDSGKRVVIQPISLTGKNASDRQKIHQVSDAIHKALFGTPGIATTKLLYTKRVRKGNDSSKWTSEVWESDYDGFNARQITKEQALTVTPTYIPPSSAETRTASFLFVSYKNGQPKIYIGNSQTGKTQRLSYLAGNQMMPAISTNRDKVAFISDIASNPDIYLQPFNPEVGAMGKPAQIFAKTGATQSSPSFSPDGTQVAFVSNKDGTPRIYIMEIPQPGTNVKNLHPKLITRTNRENTSPAWSPDGSKIAYSAKTNGTRQIWIYDLKTNTEKQLTQGSDMKENPTWAPNSRSLVFNSASKNTSELYLVTLDQAELTKISYGPGEKRFPSWEPVILCR